MPKRAAEGLRAEACDLTFAPRVGSPNVRYGSEADIRPGQTVDAACGLCRHRRQGIPWLERTEKLLKPRLSFLTRPPFKQAIAVVCLLLALIPANTARKHAAGVRDLSFFSLAILERDGIAAILGGIVALASTAIVWTVLYAVIKSAIFILGNALAR